MDFVVFVVVFCTVGYYLTTEGSKAELTLVTHSSWPEYEWFTILSCISLMINTSLIDFGFALNRYALETCMCLHGCSNVQNYGQPFYCVGTSLRSSFENRTAGVLHPAEAV